MVSFVNESFEPKTKVNQQNGEGGWLRGHPARCDAAPSLRIVLPLSVTTEILCNLNRLSWQHRCPRTLPGMPGKVILRRGMVFKLGPGAHFCTKTPGTVMLVWGSSCARPHMTCVCLLQGIQPPKQCQASAEKLQNSRVHARLVGLRAPTAGCGPSAGLQPGSGPLRTGETEGAVSESKALNPQPKVTLMWRNLCSLFRVWC